MHIQVRATKHGVVSFIAAFALAILLGDAQAQINAPTPPLMGQKSFHRWSVPGVIAGPLICTFTFFACTNTTDAAVRLGLELFDFAGDGSIDDPSATSLSAAPGGGVPPCNYSKRSPEVTF